MPSKFLSNTQLCFSYDYKDNTFKQHRKEKGKSRPPEIPFAHHELYKLCNTKPVFLVSATLMGPRGQVGFCPGSASSSLWSKHMWAACPWDGDQAAAKSHGEFTALAVLLAML